MLRAPMTNTSNAPARRVLITGTSSGFGRHAAQSLAARGHTVLATMRGVDGKNRGKAEELRGWASKGGHKLHVIEMDVTNDASVESGVARAVEAAGGIDVAISNAGIGTVGVLETFTADQVGQFLQTNVVGAFRLARAVLPLMRKAGSGYLMFVSSTIGRVILPFMGPYAATKFALEAMAETLSNEVKPLGIDLTVLQPGAYLTSLAGNSLMPEDTRRLEQYGPVKQGLEAFMQGYQAMAANGGLRDPQEVADAMVRLVENPAERLLRVPVDMAFGQALNTINETCAKIQTATMAALMGPR
jgi:NAD(P)-dependent dehydrogenase (short-subunit alcohol dehydrogenase family)